MLQIHPHPVAECDGTACPRNTRRTPVWAYTACRRLSITKDVSRASSARGPVVCLPMYVRRDKGKRLEARAPLPRVQALYPMPLSSTFQRQDERRGFIFPLSRPAIARDGQARRYCRLDCLRFCFLIVSPFPRPAGRAVPRRVSTPAPASVPMTRENGGCLAAAWRRSRSRGTGTRGFFFFRIKRKINK